MIVPFSLFFLFSVFASLPFSVLPIMISDLVNIDRHPRPRPSPSHHTTELDESRDLIDSLEDKLDKTTQALMQSKQYSQAMLKSLEKEMMSSIRQQFELEGKKLESRAEGLMKMIPTSPTSSS